MRKLFLLLLSVLCFIVSCTKDTVTTVQNENKTPQTSVSYFMSFQVVSEFDGVLKGVVVDVIVYRNGKLLDEWTTYSGDLIGWYVNSTKWGATDKFNLYIINHSSQKILFYVENKDVETSNLFITDWSNAAKNGSNHIIVKLP